MFKTPPAAVWDKSCGQCDGKDTMHMVQCDSCDIWYHFKCAGVTQSIENHAWICSKCTHKIGTPKGEARKVRKARTMSIRGTITKSKNEIRKNDEKKTENGTDIAARREDINPIRKVNYNPSVVSSQKSNIELELMQLEEQKELEQRYLRKKYEILTKSNEGSHRSKYSEESQQRAATREWVKKLPDPMQQGAFLQEPYELFEQHNNSLTTSKLAARQVLSKELPTFSGKPEEWPIFLSSYEESTKLCGFSDSENLLRLQKSLKGKAYELVSNQLLLPKNVPEIIKTLKMMFGRPEIIVTALINKIRSEPILKTDKLDSLISYAISVKNLSSSLEASGMVNHLKNPLLMQELICKLPAQTKLNWSLFIGEKDADVSIFSNWLFSLAEAATRVSDTCPLSNITANLYAHEGKSSSDKKDTCCLCDHIHLLQDCNKFAELNLQARWNTVKQHKLCRICLKRHGNFRCSDERCSIQGCEARHHKLLHKFYDRSSPNVGMGSANQNIPPVQIGSTVSTHSSLSKHLNKTLFKILPIILYHNGCSIEVFAMLDDGSNVTLIDEDICTYLGIVGESNTLCLRWTSGTTREENNSMNVSLLISGFGKDAKKYELNNVQTVKQLALPTQTLDWNSVKYYKHLRNLPIQTYSNATPKILIGLNNGHLTNILKMAEGYYNEPCASKTRLGWVIHGGDSNASGDQNVFHINTCDCSSELEKLQQQISEYFSLESAGKSYDLKSADDERSNFILESTTKRIGDRFETGLIWKETLHNIPESYHMALKRLQCLERKLSSQEAEIVTNQITNLVNKGYAKKMDSHEVVNPNGVVWYLPIFTVKNPNKPNKIRLVWDAAAKVNGTSLNTMLLKGPDLTSPLLSVLYGFRMHEIAICADIKEMFHQVYIRKEDQNAQRFLWRDGNSNKDPDIYKMQVMTFGAACSPSSAQFVKNKNALEFKESYPKAVNSILHHHYVDDLLDCAETKEAAIQLAREVASIHKKAGFVLRNFKSNSSEVLQNLQDLEETVPNENVDIELSTEKVLGMWWITKTDEFTFSLKLNRTSKEILLGEKRPTKRDVLQTLMSIFDPLGFLSPFVIYLKNLLQEVWKSTEGWNSYINDNLFQKWLIWIKLLPQIENLKIPRWYNISINCSIQLHIFVDASEKAYAAVAYLRILCKEKIVCKLVGSKAKVAPKQPLSIPRMELMAAVLGARLADALCKMHEINLEKRYFWSDSNTVLSWINSDARNYKQFVMFRIGEILEITDSFEWRYVPSKMNVADDATKWNCNNIFDIENRWYKGPSFLCQDETMWPINSKLENSKEEIRPHILLLHDGKLLVPDEPCLILERFSSWRKLLRTVSVLYKFYYVIKHIDMTRSEILQRSEIYLYNLIQRDAFNDEISSLLAGQNINKTSPLYKCSAYLDNNFILRIQGRIDLANVDENVKRPIILPRNHYGTHLIIKQFHEQYHHLHHDTCLNEIRQKFYIPRLRIELKKVRSKCQHCKNHASKPFVPEMAGLPNARLSSFVRPFSFVGIDYFGPLYVSVARRKEKRWGVIFTCMTIRAVHIEVSRDLSTDSFIIVLQNFIARRGVPIKIYSDNGTNFRGAENELKKAVKEIDFNKLDIKFSTEYTIWRFNPPASPHMGGCWERLIRSIKNILYKISPQFSFKDDTLVNALIECERVINSRPLTYVELESYTDEALTPNHFLLGSSNGQKPLGEFTENDRMLRKNWRKTQYFANLFWKRWVQEYLPTLTKRTKWFKKERQLTVNDVVIIVDSSLPRNNWPLGIIVTVHKGKDGNVRSAVVKTKDGLLTRPTAKLARLDVRTSVN